CASPTSAYRMGERHFLPYKASKGAHLILECLNGTLALTISLWMEMSRLSQPVHDDPDCIVPTSSSWKLGDKSDDVWESAMRRPKSFSMRPSTKLGQRSDLFKSITHDIPLYKGFPAKIENVATVTGARAGRNDELTWGEMKAINHLQSSLTSVYKGHQPSTNIGEISLLTAQNGKTSKDQRSPPGTITEDKEDQILPFLRRSWARHKSVPGIKAPDRRSSKIRAASPFGKRNKEEKEKITSQGRFRILDSKVVGRYSNKWYQELRFEGSLDSRSTGVRSSSAIKFWEAMRVLSFEGLSKLVVRHKAFFEV
ncbi:hypothetical protein Tco_0965326, partial [Tanacetum coccineum]